MDRCTRFDVLGDPVRRRILELLSDGEQSSGELASAIRREFGISAASRVPSICVCCGRAGSPPVARPDSGGSNQVEAAPLRDVDEWLARFRGFWNQPAGRAPTPNLDPRSRRERVPPTPTER